MATETKTNKLIMTALMICMITVSTMFLRIPVGRGYVHFGDAMIFLSILILGVKNGALASAIGSAFADVWGFAVWAPWTFIIKGVMALIMGFFILMMMKKNGNRKSSGMQIVQATGMFLAGLWMTFGYFIAEWVMYRNLIIPLLNIPWNIGQFVVGMVIALAAAASLYKTPAGKYFAYQAQAN
jgi:uncharacterized membrane protein